MLKPPGCQVYEPLKPILQPPKPIFQELQEIRGKYPTNQVLELKETIEGTEEYLLSDKEREKFNEKRHRIDTRDSFELKMPRSLKQRLIAMAEIRCTSMTHMLNEVLSEWIDEAEISESKRRGD